MRVLLVGDVPPPPGGIALHVHQWARVLAERGAEVQVIDSGKGRHRGPGVRPLGGVAGLARESWGALEGSAVVHVHVSGNNPKAWALAAAFGGPQGGSRRRLLTVHSGIAPAFLARALRNRWLARAAMAGYGTVVAVSERIRHALAAVGASAQQLHVVPAFLGIRGAPAQLPPRVAALRAQCRPLIAWASHPSPAYGLAHALDALAVLGHAAPGCGAVVYGPGTAEPGFSAEVARRCTGVRVLGLGAIPHDEVLAVLRTADLAWRPTLADGDALSVREARALGVRVLASDAANRPEGVPVYRAGNARALALASLELLSRAPPPAGAGTGVEPLWSLYLEAASEPLQRGEEPCGG